MRIQVTLVYEPVNQPLKSVNLTEIDTMDIKKIKDETIKEIILKRNELMLSPMDCINIVHLVGTVQYDLQEIEDERLRKMFSDFYDFEHLFLYIVSAKRNSGTEDRLPVLYHEKVFSVGDRVEIKGSCRTMSFIENEKQHTKTFVYADSFVSTKKATDVNNVYLQGHICKDVIFRQTPFKRTILEVVIASNMIRDNRSLPSYIHCILWGNNARQNNHRQVQDYAELYGRLQSRTYSKSQTEEHTVYEVSVEQFFVLEPPSVKSTSHADHGWIPQL